MLVTAALALTMTISLAAPSTSPSTPPSLAMSTGELAVDIVAPPPCLATYRASSRVGDLAARQLRNREGVQLRTTALGAPGFFRGELMLLPDPERGGGGQSPGALLARIADGADDVVVEPLGEVEAVRSPQELSFMLKGRPGYLAGLVAAGDRRGRSPDLVLTTVTISRVTSQETSALLVHLARPSLTGATDASVPGAPAPILADGQVSVREASSPVSSPASSATSVPASRPGPGWSTDPLDYDPTVVGLVDIDDGQGDLRMLSVMLTIGGPARLKVRFDDALAEARAATNAEAVVVVTGMRGDLPQPKVCADATRAMAPDVVVPRQTDMQLGGPQMLAYAASAGVTLVASNLAIVDGAGKETRPLQQAHTVVRGGLRVAVVGAVDPELFPLLPDAAQKSMIVGDPITAVEDTVDALLADPLPPDLIVVAASSRNLVERLATVADVDIVLGGIDGRTDALVVEHTIELRGRREDTREYAPSLVGFGAVNGVRQIRAVFDSSRSLRRLTDSVVPTTAFSPQDHAFARPFRAAWLQNLEDDIEQLLPPLDDLLARAPTAAKDARGHDLPYRGFFITVGPGQSPVWSDPLFHRLAANAMVKGLDVDAAFSATTPRGSDLGNAAVARRYVRDWLKGTGPVEIVSIPGGALKQLLTAVRTQDERFPASLWTWPAGLNLDDAVIAGRPIDDAVTYEVAFDEKSARRPDISAILKPLPSQKRFSHPSSARWEANDAGQPLETDTVVLAVLSEAVASSKADAGVEALAALLTDQSKEVRPEWRLRVDALELRGTGGQTSDNIAVFAETKETRATQPGFLQLGAKAVGSLVYDTAPFAWDTRLRLQYDTILLDVEGAPRVPQDTVDDVVLSTEGRLNAISLSSDSGAFRVVPFAQVAVDSELTPTPNPTDPDGPPLSHQALVREQLGVAAYPGSFAREVRLGLLVQQDAGDALAGQGPVRHDLGAGLEWHLSFPIWKLLFTSDVDARYFIPDSDDRLSDLALRAQLVHKLAMPLSATISVFVFFDAMLFVGKVPENDELGYNGILGGGAQFSDLFRF